MYICRSLFILQNIISRAGNRKQFLIADSRTIYAFAQKGQKFPTCTTFSDKTCDVQCKVSIYSQERDLKLILICQTVDGLSSVSLSRSNSKTIKDRIYTGNDCEWIDLNKVG